MTDSEIIKALECPASEVDVLCAECPYRTHNGLTCHSALAKDTIDLINRQKAEIETLERKLYDEGEALLALNHQLLTVKVEAIKDFVKELVGDADV
ncbi:MAG: hypothetical protein J6Q39_08210 [Bacteroidales bacterium]|nr:hypothetical protein [Bacteroidales bacterium]